MNKVSKKAISFYFIEIFYDPKYCLSWWTFQIQLKKMCIMQLWDVICYNARPVVIDRI